MVCRWLHTGDAAKRRAHMSAALMNLKSGQKVWAHSDSGTAATTGVAISGVELDASKPAFKVYNTAAFAFATKAVPFGKTVTTKVDFDLNNNAGTGYGYLSGVYTAPESGASRRALFRSCDNNATCPASHDVRVQASKQPAGTSSILPCVRPHL